MPGGRPKGHAKSGGGSRKGVPNQNTKALKDMILSALSMAGGEQYLREQAEKNPGPFMTLVGKVLPLQVSGEGGGPILIATGVSRESDGD